ncbi:hypothetical protein [Desmospora profundinema]|uniref:Uncharacterized protein n=1 Tax=Desmospora profundinema TaxID=1571184 RepID=A0ABU1IKZ4_9BACL|nr:hypothetical protein [Desmospora profundinema]MDR6225450.1 hypothetical protein [Desmospora profundinema]
MELQDLTEGYQERVDLEMHRLAWHAANLMNVHLKKKVTVKKLLGKERNMAMEERERQFTRLMEARKG